MLAALLELLLISMAISEAVFPKIHYCAVSLSERSEATILKVIFP